MAAAACLCAGPALVDVVVAQRSYFRGDAAIWLLALRENCEAGVPG
jgi:hypothetical protein